MLASGCDTRMARALQFAVALRARVIPLQYAAATLAA